MELLESNLSIVAAVAANLAIALIKLAKALDAPWIDGAGSIVIGLILAAAAIGLSRQARRLLLGEALSPRLSEAVAERLGRDEEVAEVQSLLSMYLGPSTVLLAGRLVLRRPKGVGEADRLRERLKRAIVEEAPEIRHAFLELEPPGSSPAC